MATGTLSADSSLPNEDGTTNQFGTVARLVLAPLASLKLTVALFALAIFIIFVGTLAQVDKDMWEVIDLYFRSWFAWIDFQLFFPRSWFPSLADKVRGGFPMPGGASIGLAMALNLVAAHLIRFKIQAKGPELTLGLVVLAVGIAITYWVIASGHNQDGLQGQPPFSWETLWIAVRVSTLLVAVASIVSLAISKQASAMTRYGLVVLALVCGVCGVWSLMTMPSPSSLRILWQLIQGGLVGVVLLAGCALVFKRRAGVVLLHAGIGLMMFSEFFVSNYAVEGKVRIREGETMNYLRDIRSVELAVVDGSSKDEDEVVVIPGSRLNPQPKWWQFGWSNQGDVTIDDDLLPFKVRIIDYFRNSDLSEAPAGAKNVADRGTGTSTVAVEKRPVSGTDSEINVAALYAEFYRKDNDESLGRYLLSQLVALQGINEKVEVDGKTYDVALRFKRTYKPYSLSLYDVRKDNYLGTQKTLNYSSDVKLIDDGQDVGRFRIWMNNPLRYSGETFYQSSYDVDPDGVEVTDLQVVTNTGWMMPYVGCMLVAVGMLMHFSTTLWRFLSRASRSEVVVRKNEWYDIAIPVLVVLTFAGYFGSKQRPPSETKANMRIHDFGRLPVVFEGRVKPMDTLARNTLRIISNKETYEDENENKRPAIQWLLDVIAAAPEARDHRVFRIDNLDVIETLGLQRRKGFRYAESEFAAKIPDLEAELREARQVDAEKLSFYQRKLIELERRIMAVRRIEAAFTPIPFPPIPTEEEFMADREKAMEQLGRIREMLRAVPQLEQRLERMEPPLAVPVGEREWAAFSTAWNRAYAARHLPGEAQVPDTTIMWTEMLSAYSAGNTNDFNTALEKYQQYLVDSQPEDLAQANVTGFGIGTVPFEFYFNHSQPFRHALVMYVASFVLVAVAWLTISSGQFTVFNRASFWLLILAFAIHSYALVARIMISGRPPVTNLYSSAIFIGWAVVGFGLMLERLFRMGIGNAVASVAGFSTLLIAYSLAADGDTFTVLQAVLDTQFWLATHVVCITLGYSTTFLAGLLGIVYLVSMAWRHPSLGKALTSMTYGSLCFAIFFSFVGTVLGGLWADDSWGRFWGWDPKENGALMIVLWNALILHARWGAIIRQRGLAMLAIFGNIVTAWSWFGVNELGVGLHSYGFTEGVLRNLSLFVLSQLALIGFGIGSYYLAEGKRPQSKAA